jgi:hypothetical protein
VWGHIPEERPPGFHQVHDHHWASRKKRVTPVPETSLDIIRKREVLCLGKRIQPEESRGSVKFRNLSERWLA